MPIVVEAITPRQWLTDAQHAKACAGTSGAGSWLRDSTLAKCTWAASVSDLFQLVAHACAAEALPVLPATCMHSMSRRSRLTWSKAVMLIVLHAKVAPQLSSTMTLAAAARAHNGSCVVPSPACPLNATCVQLTHDHQHINPAVEVNFVLRLELVFDEQVLGPR
eukprot:364599-Chlamydomonas_euryale.AAC.21